jgi:parallel beta-helix repeat protein
MRRVLGPFAAGIAATSAVLALSAGQAFASHVQCGDVITQDTTLDSDLIGCAGRALEIGADDITLDLNGHMIEQDPYGGLVGIDDRSGFDRLTLQGPGFIPSVYLVGSSDSSIRSLSTEEIQMRLSDGAEIKGNSLSPGQGPDYQPPCSALFLYESDGALIKNNSFSSYGGGPGTSCYGWAIAADGSDHNFIEGNSWSKNGFALTLLGDHNLIRNNSGSHNDSGITIRGDNNFIRGNRMVENSSGIELAGQNNEVTGNVAFANLSSGIDALGTNRLVRNRAIRNRLSGFTIGGGAVVERNVANENGEDGIHVYEPGATLARNRTDDNVDLGIEAIAGVIDGGGNRASGNGDLFHRGQCLNVSCKSRGGPR